MARAGREAFPASQYSGGRRRPTAEQGTAVSHSIEPAWCAQFIDDPADEG